MHSHDVDPVLVDAEHPHRVEGDRVEGLVDLREVDVLGALADLLQRLLGGVGGRLCQVGELVGDGAVGEDAAKRRASSRSAHSAEASLPAEAVHVGAGDLKLVGDLACLVDHRLCEGAGEAVESSRRRCPCGAEVGARKQVGALLIGSRRSRRPRRRRRGSPGRRCRPSACPEAQALLTVSDGTSLGMPPLIWACREGICPWPACMLEALPEAMRVAVQRFAIASAALTDICRRLLAP